jgi:F0F1-type ATP synthase membrane subunit c/vacuolar-type H+-ATPase subunit K
MGMGAIGTGIGIGIGGGEAARASARQPSGHSEIFKTMLIGQAVTETAAIFSLMVAVLLLFVPLPGGGLSGAAARLGAGFCMGFGAFGSGVGAGLTNAMACRAVGRRPDATGDVTTTMLVAQSVAQSSAIFALIIALLLTFEPSASSDLVALGKFIGAGLCMGFGALGPGYGAGAAGMYAVYAVACNGRHKPAIMRTMLLGQAVSQSTASFSLAIAILLIFVV